MREYLIDFITRRMDSPRTSSPWLKGYIDALQDTGVIDDTTHAMLHDLIRNRVNPN
jgi:hypothetical protein